jgi:hypothetical protein
MWQGCPRSGGKHGKNAIRRIALDETCNTLAPLARHERAPIQPNSPSADVSHNVASQGSIRSIVPSTNMTAFSELTAEASNELLSMLETSSGLTSARSNPREFPDSVGTDFQSG